MLSKAAVPKLKDFSNYNYPTSGKIIRSIDRSSYSKGSRDLVGDWFEPTACERTRVQIPFNAAGWPRPHVIGFEKPCHGTLESPFWATFLAAPTKTAGRQRPGTPAFQQIAGGNGGHDPDAPTPVLPDLIGRVIDGVRLSYGAGFLEGPKRLTPWELATRKYGYLVPGLVLDDMSIGGTRYTVTVIKREKRSVSLVVCRLGIGIPLISMTILPEDNPWTRTLTLRIQPAFLRTMSIGIVLEGLRSWIHMTLYFDLSPSELLLCERVSQADVAFDVLMFKGSDADLDEESKKRFFTRLGGFICHHDEETGEFSGFDFGSKRRVRLKIYDKVRELLTRKGEDAAREHLAYWNVAGLVLGDDQKLRFYGRSARVWRIEWQYHREYLHDKNIQNGDDLIRDLVPLTEAAFDRLVVMRSGNERGNVYRYSKLTPLWNLLRTSASEMRV